jgi:hypothetical protein
MVVEFSQLARLKSGSNNSRGTILGNGDAPLSFERVAVVVSRPQGQFPELAIAFAIKAHIIAKCLILLFFVRKPCEMLFLRANH